MSGRAQFKIVLLDKIVDPTVPMRVDLTPESVKELADSIRQLGLIEPLVLKQVGDSFEIIAGHRRLIASQLADLVEVPAYIVDVSDEKADLMKIHENLQRRDISPIEEGNYFNYLIKQYGWSPEKISKLIGRSDAYVYARLAINEYPEDILSALDSGAINIAVARELAQIDDDSTRGSYLDYAVRNGITWSIAEQWKREYKSRPLLGDRPSIPDPGAPRFQQPVVTMVTCPICSSEVPMKDAQMIYTHRECLERITA